MTRSELLLKKLQAARAELDKVSIVELNRIHADRASTLITDAIDLLIMRETLGWHRTMSADVEA